MSSIANVFQLSAAHRIRPVIKIPIDGDSGAEIASKSSNKIPMTAVRTVPAINSLQAARGFSTH